MFLIVGLGNPGKKYAFNRHNIGFMCVDFLLQRYNLLGFEKEEKKALVCKTQIAGQDVIFAKPQTFMNLSGESVQALLAYYKIPMENLLVIHDDLDQAFASMKMQKARGHGGQNGIRSIHQLLGSDDYARLKLGIGRPSHPGHEIADWVLSNFKSDEETALRELLEKSCDAVESFITKGFLKTADIYNRKS